MLNTPNTQPSVCDMDDESQVVVITIRCLSSVPDELVQMLAEVEQQDMDEVGL